jgi:hypothetical protein
MTTYYSLEEYNKILFDGVYGNLSNDILLIINELTEEINKTTIQTTVPSSTTYQKYSDNKYKKPLQANTVIYNKRNKLSKQVTDTDWQTLRVPFKSTQIEKKEGLEKSLNDIRICLNKLSNKNYNIQREAILELLNTIIDKKSDSYDSEEEENEENKKNEKDSEIKKVATAIFDIASNNKFFSEIYADLYKDLIGHYSIFNEIIESFIKSYKESIYEINYVDPNLEYDKFCDYNKKNDRRNALSAFITNLMKKEVIQKEIVVNIILLFQEIVFNYIDNASKVNEVEEITENIFLLVISSHLVCKNIESWQNVLDNISKISKFKTKDKVGLSNRAIFKYMDILDLLKKNSV